MSEDYEENDYNTGNNPCGFCQSNMHEECDAEDCTCKCPNGTKPKRKEEKQNE